MCFRSRSKARNKLFSKGVVGLATLVVAGLSACQRESNPAPAFSDGGLDVAVTKLFPGNGAPPAPDPRAKMYEGDPAHIANGRRYYVWYNCAGCHFNGAGGIGPAFLDDKWIYGDQLEQIRASILEGRPNGMPSWRGKIPDEQVWEIAAYVKSLSMPNAALGVPGSRQTPTAPPPPATPPPPQ